MMYLQVACGLNHTVCVTADGNAMFAFGDGDYGKLGLGNTTAKSTPTKVDSLCGVGIRKVACGTQYTVALTKDGKVFTWGQGVISNIVMFIFLHSQRWSFLKIIMLFDC